MPGDIHEISGGKFEVGGERILDLPNKADDVAALDIGLDDDDAFPILPIDRGGTIDLLEFHDIVEKDAIACRRSDLESAKRIGRGPQFLRVAHENGSSAISLDHIGDDFSRDGLGDELVDLFDAEPQSTHFAVLDLQVQVELPPERGPLDFDGTIDAVENRLDLGSPGVEDIEIVPGELHGHSRANP